MVVSNEVRLHGLALGVKQVEVVGLPHGETERHGDLVDLHRPADLGVYAADVDDESVVDEDPDVIVSTKIEDLPGADRPSTPRCVLYAWCEAATTVARSSTRRLVDSRNSGEFVV
jgi:hypothetical protein